MIEDSECAPWLLMLQRLQSLEDAVVRFGRDVENDGLPADHPVVQKGLELVTALFDYKQTLTGHLVTPDESVEMRVVKRIVIPHEPRETKHGD